jgi:hypothetical protein
LDRPNVEFILFVHFRRAAHRSGRGLRAGFHHTGCAPGCAASFVYNTPGGVLPLSLPETGFFGIGSSLFGFFDFVVSFLFL